MIIQTSLQKQNKYRDQNYLTFPKFQHKIHSFRTFTLPARRKTCAPLFLRGGRMSRVKLDHVYQSRIHFQI